LFLLIFESIGMQELILIGAIALIIFGPRKLPHLMRKAGKIMAEFRRATSDFKETWEREVDFEDFKEPAEIKPVTPVEKTIAKKAEPMSLEISAPEIKELNREEVEKIFPSTESSSDVPEKTAVAGTGKQDWL